VTVNSSRRALLSINQLIDTECNEIGVDGNLGRCYPSEVEKFVVRLYLDFRRYSYRKWSLGTRHGARFIVIIHA